MTTYRLRRRKPGVAAVPEQPALGVEPSADPVALVTAEDADVGGRLAEIEADMARRRTWRAIENYYATYKRLGKRAPPL